MELHGVTFLSCQRTDPATPWQVWSLVVEDLQDTLVCLLHLVSGSSLTILSKQDGATFNGPHMQV